ncbi:MAG: NnrU family protein [Exilibacterium sp.]
MTLLLIGLFLFFITHSVSIYAFQWRQRMVVKMGEVPWKAVYSLIALLGFVLIIMGFQTARLNPEVIYIAPVWTRHITFLLMLPVFPLLLATYLPGRIQAAVKHPMLIAVKTWAFSHLLSNGNLAEVLLFGSFLVWAVVDRISLKRRPLRPVKEAPASKYNDVIAIVGGLVLYAVFLRWGHRWLIGMPLIAS